MIPTVDQVASEVEKLAADLPEVCRTRRIGLRTAGTYASGPLTIPMLGAELERRGILESLHNRASVL